jgi:hypothetical protein
MEAFEGAVEDGKRPGEHREISFLTPNIAEDGKSRV